MPASYRYVVRNIHGAAKLESELLTLSSQAWEPINLQRDASGTYEVVLRQELNGDARPAIAQPETAASASETAPYRYSVQSFHGAANLETGVTNLSSEGWEPLSFHQDAAGTFNVVLRQNQDSNASVIRYRYGVRNAHGAAKLESELADLSADGWEPLDFHRDEAGTYHVILRRSRSVSVARPYRYAVRHVHGVAKLESELTNLSSESWEPLSFLRDSAGTYEIILRLKT